MSYPVLQFINLENLLVEAAGADALRLHIEEQIEVKTTPVLTRKEICIGLCARAIASGNRILSWYYQVDKFSFYLRGEPLSGHFHDGRSPEEERYERAWRQAERMREELSVLLRGDEYTVHTDGIIALSALSGASAAPVLLRGTTDLLPLPAPYEEMAEAA